jgi:hypothetical protein
MRFAHVCEVTKGRAGTVVNVSQWISRIRIGEIQTLVVG